MTQPSSMILTKWAAGAAVGALVLLGGVMLGFQLGLVGPASSPSPQVLGTQESVSPPASRALVPGLGRIQGTVVDHRGTARALNVCAQPTLGGPALCTLSASTGEYHLDLVAGQYTVVAYESVTPTLRGSYTERAATWAPSDQLIVVDVVPGQTIAGVSPTDWTR